MKINVAVLFGGKSVEHEISIISAIQAIGYFDTDKYHIIPVYMTKQGAMYIGKDIDKIEAYKDINTLLKKSTLVTLASIDGKTLIIEHPLGRNSVKKGIAIDVVFPIVHGTNVEDGGLQGFLKTLGVPFVGCDVLASAVGMDKHVMKLVFKDAGIPVLDCRCYLNADYYADEEKILSAIEETFDYPVIVKPVNLGSSVGISKANNREELTDSVEHAFQFSPRILVEHAIENLREINCAVMGDIYECEASECEEPLNASDILSYEDKYLGGEKSNEGSKGMASLSRKIPADIPAEMRERIRNLAAAAFTALGGNGVARIDFMIDKDTNEVYLNEINTIPGSLSFYLWEPLGISYAEMLERMINLALKRSREESAIVYSFDTNILDNCSFNGSKTKKYGKLMK